MTPLPHRYPDTGLRTIVPYYINGEYTRRFSFFSYFRDIGGELMGKVPLVENPAMRNHDVDGPPIDTVEIIFIVVGYFEDSRITEERSFLVPEDRTGWLSARKKDDRTF
ncbi:hypothetical protein [Methanofollis fontis]|uniref:hypothetical protein n=1 Tax=Methanofollis fontis TaxID=2052832 RepID=UPI00102F0835|nr:hypothetical protein [Methanofollis fontis]